MRPACGWSRMMRLAPLPLVLCLGACLSAPPPPPAPYQAVGINAAWSLLIDPQHVTFIQGQTVVREPTPTVINGIAGEIYQTPRINVNIVHSPCTAGASTYPDRVQVDVDGRRYEGCGGL